jgi:protein-tyrosine phosphatase
MIHLSHGRPVYSNMDDLASYRRMSRGWEKDQPAYIHPRILFGSGMALTPAFANKHNITHVVNCAYEEDSPEWFKSSNPTKYKCLEAHDSISANIFKWYPAFEQAVNLFMKDPSCETIYVHCQCGINRSGYLTLIYAAKRLGFGIRDVFKAILQQRPCAFTNPAYRKQVEEHFNVSL